MNEAIERDRTMSAQPHPSLEELAGFVQEPEAMEFSQLRIHVATCSDCRKNISDIEKLIIAKDSITSSLKESDYDDEKHLSNDEIKRYVSTADGDPDKHRIKTHLKTCGECQKAVLKYRSHVYANQPEPEEPSHSSTVTQPHQATPNNQTELAKDDSLWAGLRKKKPILALSAGLAWLAWLKTPTVALTGILTGVMLTQWHGVENASSDGFMVATYQEEERVTFTPKGSPIGVGFFSSANQTSQLFNGITFTNRDEYSFQTEWTPIPGANSYTLRLFLIDNGIQQLITEQSTNTNQVTVSGHEILPHKRYEWQLAGETQNEHFETRGGFVLYSQDK